MPQDLGMYPALLITGNWTILFNAGTSSFWNQYLFVFDALITAVRQISVPVWFWLRAKIASLLILACLLIKT